MDPTGKMRPQFDAIIATIEASHSVRVQHTLPEAAAALGEEDIANHSQVASSINVGIPPPHHS